MRRGVEFLDVFLRSAGPSPELLSAFATGLLVVGILADLAYGLLTEPEACGPIAWRPTVAVALMIGLAYVLFLADRRSKRTIQALVDESRAAPPHAGLIWIFGPGRFDHLLFALEHHMQSGGADHCWLLMQDIETVREAYGQLADRLVSRALRTRLHPVYINRLDAQTAYQAVRSVFEREAGEEGLRSDQVIADITGGTKPLTAGMVLAALTTGNMLEYVESERDSEGQPIPGTSRVVLADTTFYVARGE